MDKILNISQVIVAILLIVVVLLQQRGTSLGGAFGGEGDAYASRRGLEKTLYISTIVLGVIFVGLAILNIVL
jgi:preprotein translocase subunit SecG